MMGIRFEQIDLFATISAYPDASQEKVCLETRRDTRNDTQEIGSENRFEIRVEINQETNQ